MERILIETLASDALERIARQLGISTFVDDPEQVLVAAVEREVRKLIEASRSCHSQGLGTPSSINTR